MSEKKETNLSVSTEETTEEVIEEPSIHESGDKQKDQEADTEFNWFQFIHGAKDDVVKARFRTEVKSILSKYTDLLENYCCLALFDSRGGITSFDADRIYQALLNENKEQDKNVLLLILSPGGSVEPAYHISKLCKRFSKEKFVVVVPRQAKSAATLVAIGADEIHVGLLGELGPIDPQIGGLPALGVVQALQTIASLSEEYPKSSEMFARYLKTALTVEQIGYCERIGISAVQYAERLLSTKPSIEEKASEIANMLVYEYKDHGFVIDSDEAQEYLGEELVKTDTKELEFAEDFYRLFENVDLVLRIIKQQRLVVVGDIKSGEMIFNNQHN